jgi:hypothetical protein
VLRLIFALCFSLSPCVEGSDFKHIGDFLLQAHFKITGQQVTPIPMKPIAFSVFTDGVQVRVAAEGDTNSHTTFDIYRSDGIGHQRQGAGAIEIIPGVQAMSNINGSLRHLRLSRESMTMTTFPGVSDQTIVSYAIAAEPKSTSNPAPDKSLPQP